MGQVLVPEPSGPRLRQLVRSQSDTRRRWLQAAAIWIVLAVLIVLAGLISPSFLAPRNIVTLMKQAAPLGILAVGQTLVILTGGIDLSVASVMATVSVFAAGVTDGREELVWPVVLMCLGFSMAVGLANGVLVTKFRIPPFITTLGMILVVQGIRFVYTKGTPKTYIPNSPRFWGRDFHRADTERRDRVARYRLDRGPGADPNDLRASFVRCRRQRPHRLFLRH